MGCDRDCMHGCRGAPFLGKVGWTSVLGSGTAALLLAGSAPPALRAQQAAAAPLVFDGVTVVDVEHGKLIPNQRVIIAGNRIQAVGRSGTVKAPKDAQIVAARGKYLIPGLWDLHIHPGYRAPNFFYPLLLANGITGIRDPGSQVPLDTLLQWRREIMAGSRAGPPRQILSGQYITEVGYNGVRAPCNRREQAGETCVSSDPADARHLVDSLKAAGADMIKPYSLSRELYFVVAAEARRLGIPFGGHIYPWVRMAEASDSGASIVDHRGIGIRSGELDSLCLVGAASVAQCRSMAERFRRNGTWWCLTMIGLFQGGAASRSIPASIVDFTRRFWESDTVLHGKWNRDTLLGNNGRAAGAAADSLRGLMGIMQLVDFPILASTDVGAPAMGDLLPGLSLHGEMAMYVAEGLSPLNALRSATLNPAKLLHGTDSLGTVAPGKLADLVLLDANPLADITNTTTIRAVVANGRYFDRAALDRVLAEVKAKAKQEPKDPFWP